VNHPRLGRPLPPAPLDGVALAFDAPTDRRQHLADWLTSPDNPYFARAFVNRVWKNFMGRGLVEAVDDMRATNPPSNEELLAALTRDFTAHNFDVKHLIRTIMNSAAYQRSAEPNETNRQDERFYSRYVVRRLPAEVLLDAVSQVTGVPTAFPGYPRGTRALQLPDASVNQYFLSVFGKPPRLLTVESERSSEPSVAQALHTINGETINQKLRAPDGVVASFLKLGLSDEMMLEHLYTAALSRPPSAAEKGRLLPLLAESRANTADRRQALEDIVWALLTSKEFLFNH
jgi:disulfide oxidoreductase YuzD